MFDKILTAWPLQADTKTKSERWYIVLVIATHILVKINQITYFFSSTLEFSHLALSLVILDHFKLDDHTVLNLSEAPVKSCHLVKLQI